MWNMSMMRPFSLLFAKFVPMCIRQLEEMSVTTQMTNLIWKQKTNIRPGRNSPWPSQSLQSKALYQF